MGLPQAGQTGVRHLCVCQSGLVNVFLTFLHLLLTRTKEGSRCFVTTQWQPPALASQDTTHCCLEVDIAVYRSRPLHFAGQLLRPLLRLSIQNESRWTSGNLSLRNMPR